MPDDRGAVPVRTNPRQLALLIVTAALSMLAVLPLMWMLSGGFKVAGEATQAGLLPLHPTLANFADLFGRAPVLRWLVNSIVVAGAATALGLLLHSMAGYSLARVRFPGRGVAFFAVTSTLFVAPPVILVPLFVVTKQLGLLDSYPGLILPLVFGGFGIVLLRQFYLQVPPELEEAARIDGCGYWRTYWSVMLPIARPVLSALAVILFQGAWNSFLWPLTITNDSGLWVMQVGLASFQTQYEGAWNLIMAASTVSTLPTLLLFFVFQRQLVTSVKTTGLR